MARTKATARKSVHAQYVAPVLPEKDLEKQVTRTFNDPSYGEFTTTLHYTSDELFNATTKLSRPLSKRDEHLFGQALGNISVSEDRLTLVRTFDNDQEYEEKDLDLYFNEDEMEFVQDELDSW